jgi:fructose-1,6-bisphosphatase/inositol monophosphatase family enzyme
MFSRNSFESSLFLVIVTNSTTVMDSERVLQLYMEIEAEELEKYLEVVKTFVVERGLHVLNHWDELVVNKINAARTDVSTNFDEEIERDFAKLVEENFPGHGFVGEEVQELTREAEYQWHIDPIDGTKYFVRGIPLWCVTLALVHKGEPILGIVYNPPAKQLHHAIKGEGAFMNGQKIEVNDFIQLETMQIAYDFPVMDKLVQRYDEAHKDKFSEEELQPILEYEKDLKLAKKYSWEDFRKGVIKQEAELREKAYRVRDIGSGAYSLVWLAQGIYSGYVIPAQPIEKFVDIAAGLLIAQEAGASVFRQYLSPNLYQLVVGNSKDTVNSLKFALRP